jgi:hypothetical protein
MLSSMPLSLPVFRVGFLAVPSAAFFQAAIVFEITLFYHYFFRVSWSFASLPSLPRHIYGVRRISGCISAYFQDGVNYKTDCVAPLVSKAQRNFSEPPIFLSCEGKVFPHPSGQKYNQRLFQKSKPIVSSALR